MSRLILSVDGHAEVSEQHQAHSQRAGLGKAEEVHQGFWSRRLKNTNLLKDPTAVDYFHHQSCCQPAKVQKLQELQNL